MTVSVTHKFKQITIYLAKSCNHCCVFCAENETSEKLNNKNQVRSQTDVCLSNWQHWRYQYWSLCLCHSWGVKHEIKKKLLVTWHQILELMNFFTTS